MKCTACGKELSSDSRFCNYCGTPVILSKNIDSSRKSENERNQDSFHFLHIQEQLFYQYNKLSHQLKQQMEIAENQSISELII